MEDDKICPIFICGFIHTNTTEENKVMKACLSLCTIKDTNTLESHWTGI